MYNRARRRRDQYTERNGVRGTSLSPGIHTETAARFDIPSGGRYGYVIVPRLPLGRRGIFMFQAASHA
jgi:hypothetical protein